MTKIHKVKVRSSQVGRITPFPLIYLFPASLLGKMRKAFSSFIGFPLKHHINIAWDRIHIQFTIEGVTRKNREKAFKPLKKLIPDLFRDEDPWHAAVPILNRNKPPSKQCYARRNGLDPRDLYYGQANYNAEEEEDTKPVLGYIKSDKWETQPGNGGTRPAYPPTAYFATKEKVHRSICSSCPRYVFHQAGKCMVGDKACFETLRDYYAPNMFSKLREYDEFIERLPDTEKE